MVQISNEGGDARQVTSPAPRPTSIRKKVLLRILMIFGALVVLGVLGLAYAYSRLVFDWYAECADTDDVAVHCTFTNPEDFVFLTDGSMLVTQYSDEKPLLRYFPAERERMPLGLNRAVAGNCSEFEFQKMKALGITLVPHNDEAEQAFAITNHGGHGQINVFALNPRRDQIDLLACHAPSIDYFLNDLTPDGAGGFFVTAMFDRALGGSELVLKLISQEPTGAVLHLNHAGIWRRIAETRGVMPNGIGWHDSHLWVSYSGESKVRRYSLGLNDMSVELVNEWDVPTPDNLTYTGAGGFLVASQSDELKHVAQCSEPKRGVCAKPSAAYLLHPDIRNPHLMYTFDGPPMGSVSTVATHMGQLWAGTNSGNRLAVVRLLTDEEEARRFGPIESQMSPNEESSASPDPAEPAVETQTEPSEPVRELESPGDGQSEPLEQLAEPTVEETSESPVEPPVDTP